MELLRAAVIFVEGTSKVKIEAWRRRWDPIMAERVPAHITLIFPNEAHDGQVLLDRAEKACRRRPSFSLGLLGVTCPNGRPEELVFVEVHDEEGSFVQLRSELLGSPCALSGMAAPHITIVHPATSSLGKEAWESLRGNRLDESLVVTKISIIESSGQAWTRVAQVNLG